jgi:hypothetical protein
MNSTDLTQFEQTLLKIDNICRENDLLYCVIGGVAIMFHLEYRTTKDIDISLCLDFEDIHSVGEIILQHFESVYKDPLEFFERYFVLPIRDPETGIRIDVSAGLGGFERTAVERGKRVQFAGVKIQICTVEDLIIFKLVAARPIDLADVEMLIQKFSSELDGDYLENTAREFVQLERGDVLERLKEYQVKSKA